MVVGTGETAGIAMTIIGSVSVVWWIVRQFKTYPPRCPKCRYAVNPTWQSRCPECGFATQSVIRWHRRRISSSFVLFGLLSIAIGVSTITVSPALREGGLIRIIPIAMILRYPDMFGTDRTLLEVEHRLSRGKGMSDEQLRQVVDICVSILEQSNSTVVVETSIRLIGKLDSETKYVESAVQSAVQRLDEGRIAVLMHLLGPTIKGDTNNLPTWYEELLWQSVLRSRSEDVQMAALMELCSRNVRITDHVAAVASQMQMYSRPIRVQVLSLFERMRLRAGSAHDDIAKWANSADVETREAAKRAWEATKK